MKKKILFVSYGESRSIKSWSNIPYLFSENLIRQGYEIIRLNILPDEKIDKKWKKFIEKPLSYLYKRHQYSYIRSFAFRHSTFQMIKKVINANPDLYFSIFLNFEFYNKFTSTPSLLLGDWTYDIVILDRLNRMPYFFEKWFIKYQKEAIQNSEIVISLFEDAKNTIAERYKKNVHHLGINVVNDLNINPISKEEILLKKKKSNQLLLIGSLKYLEGARKLVEAFRISKRNNPSLILNIVGIPMDKLNVTDYDSDINCYHYLNKENESENKIYYDLIINAKTIVNPSETWAAYSSTIEAMKYFTPVIIKPYDAFSNDFGSVNDFGISLENTEISTITNALQKISNMDNVEYLKLCKKANDLVKDYTWENYTEKITELMEKTY